MRTILRFPLPFLCVLALAGCGREGSTRADTDAAQRPDSLRIIYGATGGDNVRVVPVEIEIPGLPDGWEGMRVAALSDFHLGAWHDNPATARAAVERAVAERPDAFVLLGDYAAGGDFAALDRVLEPLRGKPVFAVLGDRDVLESSDGPDTTAVRTREALRRNGVQLLENTRARFVRRGDTAYIAGIEPYAARRPDWQRAEIYGTIPGGAQTPLLLSHMPVAAVSMPTDRYRAVVAGHTFCGQVEVPGTPRLTWLNTEVLPGTPEPASTRIYRVRGATMFVTCGVGFGFVPIRYGAPPEVAMITLRGVGRAAATDSAQATDGVNVDSLIQQFTPDSAPRAAQDSAAGR